jgi:hypothetical protein
MDAMRVTLWELVVGVVGLLFALVFLLGGGLAIGTFFSVGSLGWLAYRFRFVDAGPRPGSFSIGRAYLDVVRAAILFVTVMGVSAITFIASRHHWDREVRGQVAIYALAGLAFFLLRELKNVSDSAVRRFDGGLAEETVVASLTPLASDGWHIQNNVLRDDGWGDVDVVVEDGHGRVFAIETKSRPLRRRDVRQALGNAAWLKQHLGVRWATAVVCVPGDEPARRDGVAWIVGAQRLADWIRTAES